MLIIAISQDVQTAREAHEPSHPKSRNSAETSPDSRLPKTSTSGTARLDDQDHGMSGPAGAAVLQQSFQPANLECREQPISETTDSLSCFKEPSGDFDRASHLDTGMTLGQGDWTYQDFDMTFFETLMRETNGQMDNNGGYWWLL